MTWFRDYIYFPLGGSRNGKWKTIRNILIVWGISGLWHGANWTFVCWGLFHAALLIAYNLINFSTKYNHDVACGCYIPSIKEVLQMSSTFFFAVIGWIIFRAENITQAYRYLTHMFSTLFIDFTIQIYGKAYILYGIIMLIIEWLQRDKQHALQFPDIKFFSIKYVRWAIYISIIVLIKGLSGMSQTFIYFQF